MYRQQARRASYLASTVLASILLVVPAAEAATDLIKSSRGGSPLWDYCYGKPDATPLPPDPRSLVQPGVSAGEPVHFNAYWKNCHVDPVAVGERGRAPRPAASSASASTGGDALLDTGGPGVGALFTATDPRRRAGSARPRSPPTSTTWSG